jgi:hypothetical protein
MGCRVSHRTAAGIPNKAIKRRINGPIRDVFLEAESFSSVMTGQMLVLFL